MMTEVRDAANKIIRAILSRERTDIRLPPVMVSIIILAYVVIIIYYAKDMFSRYDSVPLPQLFTLIAMFTIGAGLLIAIFYLLMIRNAKHAEREKELRSAMIEYAESNNILCGSDIAEWVERLKAIDADICEKEKIEFNWFYLILIMVPILIGTVIVILTGDTDRLLTIVGISFLASLAVAILVTPTITTFPMKHELRALVFFKEWNSSSVSLGLPFEQVDRTIGYRSFWVSLILTVLTLGIYWIFWAYAMFRDMNRHFEEQWYFEDNLLKSLRAKEIAIRDSGASRGVDYNLEDNWVNTATDPNENKEEL